MGNEMNFRDYTAAALLANRLPVLAAPPCAAAHRATLLRDHYLYAVSEINHMLSSLLRSLVRVRGWLYYTFSRHQIIFSRIE